jgi:hypothetical protein
MSATQTGNGVAPPAGRWKKVKAVRSGDLALDDDDRADDDDPGLPDGVSPDDPPDVAIDRLAAAARHPEAVHLLAAALPKREAVWWACLAARHVLGPAPRPKIVACLEAAEAWVYKPVEERRVACYRAAGATRPETPAALAALAAAWSGGSMVPPDAGADIPPVPPGEALTARAVANAIILAAVKSDPAAAPALFARFLAQGRDIADGGTGALDAGGTGEGSAAASASAGRGTERPGPLRPGG